jgi:predicted regulator of Ras-like GTPase activity (Roadblock/LC7/MglB family)
MKVKMFGHIKNLLRKWVETPDETHPAPPVSPAPAPRRPIQVSPPVEEAAPAHRNGSHQNGRGIEVPLQPIIGALPLELQPRLTNPDAGARTISVPVENILAQLSRGIVKISFGELRQAAPDLFSAEADRDSVAVQLPLREILSRLNPALITRRRVQRQVEVPAEISSPFDPRSQGLVFSMVPARPESAPAPAPVPRQAALPAPAPVAPPPRGGIAFTLTLPLPAAAPVPINTCTTSSTARALRELSPSQPPTPTAPLPSTASRDPSPLLINLTSLAERWPEAVRHELMQLNLLDARVALPAEIVERALKQGRVAFTWETLRSWIKPLPLPVVSVHDSLVLELPLKTVAPLFLARQKEVGKMPKKVVVDDEIPDLFFGFPRSESASAVVASAASPAPAKSADTNFYVRDDTADQPGPQEMEAKPSSSPGTRFVAKYATPNEVVSRAAALDGVAGALITLPDGLMVASRLAPDLNGDTLAAFLPQIFGKVNQCTKELRMGELNNVNFTVGNIPWKIFRVNAIFFAAFGRAGEPLPTAQLAALTADLDRRPK